jgi:hypothetical protein
MFLAFLDCRKARERAAVRRETIISRELQYRGGRIAEREHGFAVNRPPIDGRRGDGETGAKSPLVKPSA